MDYYERLDATEAAAELGLSAEEVTRLCEEGLIDAFPHTDREMVGGILRPVVKEGRAYWIEQTEIDRFKRYGPRRRMAFEEAMTLLREGKFVRRASWPRDGLVIRPYLDLEQILLWEHTEFRARDGSGTDYSPSDEDKVATDWVEYDMNN